MGRDGRIQDGPRWALTLLAATAALALTAAAPAPAAASKQTARVAQATTTPEGVQRVVRGTFQRNRRSATLLRLRISGLTPDVRVRVRCKGRGCRATHALGTPRGELMNGMRAFRKPLRLARGGRIDVWIDLPGGNAEVVRYRVRRRGRVSVATLCAASRTSLPSRC